HGVGAIEYRVRNGLASAQMRDLRNTVIEALDVLDIDGRVDVNPAVQQLLDVEIALGMATAGRVGVGKLVDEDDLRPPRDDGVKVHLVEPLAPVFDPPSRNDLETFEQRLGLLAAVRLHDANDDVVTVLFPGTSRLQHLVGLADARRSTHKDSELADAALFAPGCLQQRIRRRSLITVTSLISHSAIRPQFLLRSAGLLSGCAIQREVECQDVDARFAKNAQKPA